jgi:glycosyltransferase involved in cell wall biosynthesis
VQYAAPSFRRLAQHPQIDLLVAYCTLQGAQPGFDREFGFEVAWDVPLLDGYKWVLVPARFIKPRLGSFWGLINPGLWKLIREGDFDAVFVFGHPYMSCWIAFLATKMSRAALIMAYDATTLEPQDGKRWKIPIKRFLLPKVFGLAEIVCGGSSGTVRLLESLAVRKERIVLSPGATDNEFFRTACRTFSREDLRREWNIPLDAPVVLFCGKLQAWKRPQDLLQAFAGADVAGAYLLFAGEGPLRGPLENTAHALGVADRVRFLGFLNQSKLPGAYVASDVLVLPSEYETFGLVVSEAMACGLPVVVSDHVGARFDLIEGLGTGVVYPTADVGALANILRQMLPDGERLHRMGEAARVRMQTWSPNEKIGSFLQAVEQAVDLKHKMART